MFLRSQRATKMLHCSKLHIYSQNSHDMHQVYTMNNLTVWGDIKKAGRQQAARLFYIQIRISEMTSVRAVYPGRYIYRCARLLALIVPENLLWATDK